MECGLVGKRIPGAGSGASLESTNWNSASRSRGGGTGTGREEQPPPRPGTPVTPEVTSRLTVPAVTGQREPQWEGGTGGHPMAMAPENPTCHGPTAGGQPHAKQIGGGAEDGNVGPGQGGNEPIPSLFPLYGIAFTGSHPAANNRFPFPRISSKPGKDGAGAPQTPPPGQPRAAKSPFPVITVPCPSKGKAKQGECSARAPQVQN